MMIGQLVERILAEGYDVYIVQRDALIVLCIRACVENEFYGVDWVVSREELASVHQEALLHVFRDSLQELRNSIDGKKVSGQ